MYHCHGLSRFSDLLFFLHSFFFPLVVRCVLVMNREDHKMPQMKKIFVKNDTTTQRSALGTFFNTFKR